MLGGAGKSADDQEALALMLACQRIEGVLLRWRKRGYDFLAHSLPGCGELAPALLEEEPMFS